MLAGIVAAIAIPSLVLLYFLKLRRRDVEVSTTLLWKKTIQDFQANAPFQKLRTNILLLLQLLALILVILGIAQPSFMHHETASGRLIVMVDRSASMNTMDEVDASGRAISRLEKAKLEALARIESMAPGGLLSGNGPEVMLVVFDSGAELVLQFTGNLPEVRRAIAAIAPSDTPTDFTDAARIVQPYAGPQSAARSSANEAENAMVPGDPVLLLTDGRVPNLDQLQLAQGSNFQVSLVGQRETGNIAITALRAERSIEQPDEVSVFVAIQSTVSQAKGIDLEVSIDGVVQSARTIALAAGSDETPTTGGTVFRFRRETGGLLTVRAMTDDAMPIDDVARLMLPAQSELAVALVSAGNWAIRAAIEALNPGRFEVIAPADFSESDLRSFDLVILDGLPRSRNGDPTDLPPGRYLIFGGVPAIGGIKPVEPFERESISSFVDWHREHPALRYLALDPILIGRSLTLEHDERAAVLARGSDGPLILDVADPTRRAIVVAFSPAASNWPLDVSFALFVAQASRWLGDASSLDGERSIQPGQTLSAQLPAGASDVKLRVPDASEPLALNPSADGRISYGPVMRAGLYRLEWSGVGGPRDVVNAQGAYRLLAVNLLDPVESRVAVDDAAELSTGQTIAQSSDQRIERPRRLWPWLALAGLLIVMAEWYIYNRRIHL